MCVSPVVLSRTDPDLKFASAVDGPQSEGAVVDDIDDAKTRSVEFVTTYTSSVLRGAVRLTAAECVLMTRQKAADETSGV